MKSERIVPTRQSAQSEITIKRIDAASSFLEAVISLHGSDGQGLGMFPRGAFAEHAERKWILIAHDEAEFLLGYLLYREAKQRAMIAHLCVRRDCRLKGVGRALIEKLKSDTRHLRGIGLWCRRDYGARSAWPRYGFAPVATKRGRGADGAELELWWLDHNHADLFSIAAATQSDTKVRAVIDANVFYDLHERNTPESLDSKALLADWLQEEIELLLTREILVEIARAPDEAQRKKSNALTSRHQILRTEDAKVQSIVKELQSQLPAATCLRDDSDIRQIAHAIAADIPFFVTRDTRLIECSEPLFAKYGLRVLHPTDLINHIDSLRRDSEYRPVRIEGSRLIASRLRVEQLDSVLRTLCRSPHEKLAQFEKTVRHFLARPAEYECTAALSEDKLPVALLVRTAKGTSPIQVAMFRLSEHSLAPTVGRSLIRSLVDSASLTASLIQVTDAEMRGAEKAALSDLGFLNATDSWMKAILTGLVTARDLKNSLMPLPLLEPTRKFLGEALDAYASHPTVRGAADIEQAFWPAKLKESELPSFIIPIQAQWAQHFFDTDLASEMLFGLRSELHLGLEGAYYCSAKNTILRDPGRVLWYVSKGPEGRGSMTLKACSRIEEVMIGKPKELFKKLNRLGVYEWRDISKTIDGDIGQPILAFRFSMTERFAKPVDVPALRKFGIQPPIMSPRKITAQQFAQIYESGKNSK